MNGAIAAAERAKESRDAARAWRRAGFIDDDVLARILSLHPDDRRRFGPGFRSLAFIFTGIAVFCIVGLWYAFFDHNPEGNASLVFWGLVLAVVTEFQRGQLRRTDAGAESATALLAVSFGVTAAVVGSVGTRFEDIPLRLLGSSCLLCSLAAWRWGDRLFFLGAGLSGFGLLAQLDQGRLLWIVVSAVLVPLCISGAREVRLAPSHRRGAATLGAVAVLALYAAVHIWSLDERVIEQMRVTHSAGFEATSSPFRTLSILATALLPPLLLVAGWKRREPLLLSAGLLLIGASIATIRIYREVMPLSFALILVGGACMGLALGVRRWLRSGHEGERDGFTADPLFDQRNRTEAIRSVVALASFTPDAQATPARTAFEGGGGGFGGGGASGAF